VGDFNKDGLRDIAITSEANAIYIGYSGLRNARWLKLEIDGPISSVISTADLYGDGAPKIIVGTETGKIVFLDGGSQKVLGEININEEFSKATGSFGLNHPIRYPAAIGELNGDRTPDIVVLTHQGGVMALHGATLERLWYELPDSSDGVENQLNQNLLLGDLDGDNLLDVLVRTPGGRLRAFKGSGQSKDRKMMLWEKSDTYYATFPALADFNKNGALDVVASDISGQLYIIEGATGDVLWKNGMPGASLIGPPLIADLDNDHRLDIAVFKADGQVYKLATNSVTASSAPIWTQIFGNSKNTNSVVPKRQDIRISYAAMLGAILLMAAVLAGNYFLRKQRRDLARA
jgi:outer membrane protein assembly factor BamB